MRFARTVACSPTPARSSPTPATRPAVTQRQAHRRDPKSENDVWWGSVNIALDHHSFRINRERANDYLNTRKRLYCIDGFAGWDPRYRLKVRVICARPYHALFMHNMLIRPTAEELDDFGEPDYVIYNAGQFPANRCTDRHDVEDQRSTCHSKTARSSSSAPSTPAR